jgi:hypothetical protein
MQSAYSIKGSLSARPAYYTSTVAHPVVMHRLMLLFTRYQHKADFVNGQWPQYSWVSCMNRKLGKYPHQVAPLFEDEDPDHACQYCSTNGHPCIVSFEGVGPVCLPRSEQDRGPAHPDDAAYYASPKSPKRPEDDPRSGRALLLSTERRGFDVCSNVADSVRKHP